MESSAVSRFDLRLIAGLDEDEVAEFHSRWESSKFIRESIKKVLTKSLECAIIKTEDREILDSPNALAALADLNGYRRACREAIRLLTN